MSFIIPTYNRAHVIRRSAESALSQTYRDFEIIIVDDGSTDETFDALTAIVQVPCVRYLRHEKNMGSQAARNTGIKHARGDYIAFLDSDDTWVPNKIELQLDALGKKGEDCVVVTGIQKIENGAQTKFFDRRYEGFVYPELLARDGPGYGCLLVPRAWFTQIGFLDENISAFADWDTCISLSKLFEFTTVAEPCVNYYQDDPTAVQKNKRELARSYQYIVEKHQKDMVRYIGKRGLARHYRMMALSFDDAGDFGRCRTYMVKAFKNDDRDPMTFFLALFTLFGGHAFHLRRPIASLKNAFWIS